MYRTTVTVSCTNGIWCNKDSMICIYYYQEYILLWYWIASAVFLSFYQHNSKSFMQVGTCMSACTYTTCTCTIITYLSFLCCSTMSSFKLWNCNGGKWQWQCHFLHIFKNSLQCCANRVWRGTLLLAPTSHTSQLK